MTGNDEIKKENGTRRFSLFSNWTSMAGLALMLCALVSGLIFFLTDLFTEVSFTYLGVIYTLIALGFGFGLLLALLGAGILWLRRRSGKPRRVSPPRFDLHRSKHRVAAVGVMALAVVLLGLVGSGSYQTIVYVESDEFCTESCHSVMRPEGVAHLNSPHAKVNCVDCHVGSGAGSFVQAKLNGVNQLIRMIKKDYERPIHSPINRMDASKTCEDCHWRTRWIGYKEKVFTYYSSEEDNRVNHLRLLMKIGGAYPGGNGGAGIHYHMTLGREIQYVARDEDRREIAMVRLVKDGQTLKEYNHADNPLTDEERGQLPVRTMDCLDCHNRPAHQFLSPMVAVNQAMASGLIDTDIPYIKRQAVTVLSGEYEHTDAALAAIAKLPDYYEEEYPDFLDENRESIENAVAAIGQIYKDNFFPGMKARWDAYPDNLGHRDSAGCFRCHNDEMVTNDGETVFSTCTKCHTILEQGYKLIVGDEGHEGEAFYHVADDEELEEYTDCSDCHDGGAGTY